LLRVLVGERLDHIASIICHVMRVKDNNETLQPVYPTWRLFQTGTVGWIGPHNDTNSSHVLQDESETIPAVSILANIGQLLTQGKVVAGTE
jgi:hypothetical protein